MNSKMKKTIQNQSKLNRKSIKNRPKINPKSIKKRPKIDPKSTKITAGAKNVARFVLGGLLEASWRSLRGQHSSKLASQIEGKSIKNQC